MLSEAVQFAWPLKQSMYPDISAAYLLLARKLLAVHGKICRAGGKTPTASCMVLAGEKLIVNLVEPAFLLGHNPAV